MKTARSFFTRFTIRDIMWATVVICLVVTWRVDVTKLERKYRQRMWTAEYERDQSRSAALSSWTSLALRSLIDTAVRDGRVSREKMNPLLTRVDELSNRRQPAEPDGRLLRRDEYIAQYRLETLDLIRTVLEAIHRDDLPVHSTRAGSL